MVRLHRHVARPNYATLFLLRNLHVPARTRSVLEVGTGTGLVALVLLKRHRLNLVTAIDVNPFAVSLARENLRRLVAAGTAQVRQGHLYEPVRGQRFDAIVSVPPYVPTPPESIRRGLTTHQDFFYCNTGGGPNGRDFIDGLIADAPRHLHRGGILGLVHPSYVSMERTRRAMSHVGLAPAVVASRAFPLGALTSRYRTYIERHLGIRFERGRAQEMLHTLNVIVGLKE